MAQKYKTALGVAGGERKQQRLLLWVGEWGGWFLARRRVGEDDG